MLRRNPTILTGGRWSICSGGHWIFIPACPARVNQHVSIIRPTSELNPHFLQAYLISPATKSKLLFNSGGGATREAITKSMIENLEVPIPDIKVQERIINHIQKVKEVNSKIIIEQQSKLTYLKALKSSLLDRAFKGDL